MRWASSRNNGKYMTYINSTTISRYLSKHSLPCKIWLKHTKNISRGNYLDDYTDIGLTLIGFPGCGKFRFIERLIFAQYNKLGSRSSTAKHYRKSLSLSGGSVVLQLQAANTIFDTLPWSKGFYIFCFDISDTVWDTAVRFIIRMLSRGYRMMLVATKCDLMWDADIYEQNDQIFDEYVKITTTAVLFAQKWNIPYIETSAKYNINIGFVFEQA
eukprot:161319_1